MVEDLIRFGGTVEYSLSVYVGLATNDFLMQFQSDILGKTIFKPRNEDYLGSCILYGWHGLRHLRL